MGAGRRSMSRSTTASRSWAPIRWSNVSAGGLMKRRRRLSSRVWYDADAGTYPQCASTPRPGRCHPRCGMTALAAWASSIPFPYRLQPAHAVKFWLETAEDLEAFSSHLPAGQQRSDAGPHTFLSHGGAQIADGVRACHPRLRRPGLTGALQMFGPSELCIADGRNARVGGLPIWSSTTD